MHVGKLCSAHLIIILCVRDNYFIGKYFVHMRNRNYRFSRLQGLLKIPIHCILCQCRQSDFNSEILLIHFANFQ